MGLTDCCICLKLHHWTLRLVKFLFVFCVTITSLSSLGFLKNQYFSESLQTALVFVYWSNNQDYAIKQYYDQGQAPLPCLPCFLSCLPDPVSLTLIDFSSESPPLPAPGHSHSHILLPLSWFDSMSRLDLCYVDVVAMSNTAQMPGSRTYHLVTIYLTFNIKFITKLANKSQKS